MKNVGVHLKTHFVISLSVETWIVETLQRLAEIGMEVAALEVLLNLLLLDIMIKDKATKRRL